MRLSKAMGKLKSLLWADKVSRDVVLKGIPDIAGAECAFPGKYHSISYIQSLDHSSFIAYYITWLMVAQNRYTLLVLKLLHSLVAWSLVMTK